MSRLVKAEKMVVIVTPDGEEDGLFYRAPTTKEMHAYQNESVRRKGNSVKFRNSQANYKFGKAILTGIRDGDFTAENDNGKEVPISSNAQSPDYREDWLQLLENHAPADIIALGAHVFGGTEAVSGEDDIPKN